MLRLTEIVELHLSLPLCVLFAVCFRNFFVSCEPVRLNGAISANIYRTFMLKCIVNKHQNPNRQEIKFTGGVSIRLRNFCGFSQDFFNGPDSSKKTFFVFISKGKNCFSSLFYSCIKAPRISSHGPDNFSFIFAHYAKLERVGPVCGKSLFNYWVKKTSKVSEFFKLELFHVVYCQNPLRK